MPLTRRGAVAVGEIRCLAYGHLPLKGKELAGEPSLALSKGWMTGYRTFAATESGPGSTALEHGRSAEAPSRADAEQRGALVLSFEFAGHRYHHARSRGGKRMPQSE